MKHEIEVIVQQGILLWMSIVEWEIQRESDDRGPELKDFVMSVKHETEVTGKYV